MNKIIIVLTLLCSVIVSYAQPEYPEEMIEYMLSLEDSNHVEQIMSHIANFEQSNGKFQYQAINTDEIDSKIYFTRVHDDLYFAEVYVHSFFPDQYPLYKSELVELVYQVNGSIVSFDDTYMCKGNLYVSKEEIPVLVSQVHKFINYSLLIFRE